MGKIKKVTTRSKAILGKVKIDKGETLHIGADVHKGDYHIAVWSIERDMLVHSWVQKPSATTLMKRLEPVREHVARIVYEAGPTGFWLARTLRDNGWPVEVVSAAHTPVAAIVDPKCDRIDAKKLSEYSSKNLLREVYTLAEWEELDRQVYRTRDRTVRMSRRRKQQIKSWLLYSGVAEPDGLKNWSNASVARLRTMKLPALGRYALDMLLDELDYAKSQVLKATAKLRELSREARHREQAERLQSVPGVGSITAMAFVLELPNPKRFAGPRQVARMLGLSPEVRASGQTRRETGRQAGGNRRLRTALVEAAWQWTQRDATAHDHYRRLLANTGEKKKAIVGVARKLGIVLWRMLVSGQPYCPGMVNVPRSVFEGMKRQTAKQ